MTPDLANNALTTLESMKAILGVVDESQDIILTLLINGASEWVHTMTDRKLGRQGYVERCIASGQQELVLREWPIVTIEYVKDVESGEVIDPALYHYPNDGQSGILYKDSGWPYQAYMGGLAYDPVAFRRTLEVSYSAGYVLPKDGTPEDPRTLPYDLEQLVWEMVQQKHFIRTNGAQGLSAFSISDVSWTFDKTQNETWSAVISRYARKDVG